jgi:hypothetical protein
MRLCALLLLLPLLGCDDDRRVAGDGGSTPPATDGGGTPVDGAMSGGRVVGDPCTSDDQCTEPPDAECFTESVGSVSWPNGFCSKPCGDEDAPDDECGPTAGCATLSSSGGGSSLSGQFCSPPCESDADCRSDEGYGCQLILGFGVCAPPGI